MKRPLRIGLLGPYHSRNFGDTAIQMAVISNLRRIFPNVKIVGICPDPPDTERTHGIPAFPLSGLVWNDKAGCWQSPSMKVDLVYGNDIFHRVVRKLYSIYEERLGRLVNISMCCRSLDVLLISGSGQLEDFWGGPWKHPFSLLIWSLCSRFWGVKVIVFGIGWDNLSTRLGKFFAFSAMRLAHHRVFRDIGTVQKLLESGVRLESHLCPDLAFGLEPPSGARAENTPAIIMVCPIAARAWQENADSSYSDYIEELVKSCAHWLGEGHIVRLASSQTSLDLPLVEGIATRVRAMAGETASLHIDDAESVSHYIQLAKGADLVVASRLHALILAAVAETPLVAISPTRKATQLMKDLGLGDYCIELQKIQAEHLQALVNKILSNRIALHDGLKVLLGQYRHDLDVHYQKIKMMAAGTL